LQLDARIVVPLNAGGFLGGPLLLHLLQQPVVWLVVFHAHQDFGFMLRAYKMHGSIGVRGTWLAPQYPVRLRVNHLRVSDFFGGLWLAHLQVRLRADKLRVSDFIKGIQLI
jgi:hypothetical protein